MQEASAIGSLCCFPGGSEGGTDNGRDVSEAPSLQFSLAERPSSLIYCRCAARIVLWGAPVKPNPAAGALCRLETSLNRTVRCFIRS